MVGEAAENFLFSHSVETQNEMIEEDYSQPTKLEQCSKLIQHSSNIVLKGLQSIRKSTKQTSLALLEYFQHYETPSF